MLLSQGRIPQRGPAFFIFPELCYKMMGMRGVASVLLIVLSLSASAEAAQSRFKNLTEEEAAKLWVEEIAAYIMTKTEREVWDSLATSEDRVRFIEAFW